jgi:hypothetical protein
MKIILEAKTLNGENAIKKIMDKNNYTTSQRYYIAFLGWTMTTIVDAPLKVEVTFAKLTQTQYHESLETALENAVNTLLRQAGAKRTDVKVTFE